MLDGEKCIGLVSPKLAERDWWLMLNVYLPKADRVQRGQHHSSGPTEFGEFSLEAEAFNLLCLVGGAMKDSIVHRLTTGCLAD